MTGYYEIVVRGHLEPCWTEWFDGFTISNQPDGAAILCGPVADQAALYGILNRIRDLGLPLIAIRPLEHPPEPD